MIGATTKTTPSMKSILLAASFAGLCSATFESEAQTLPILTNGLIAYYPLNGSVFDATGGGNDGTPYNITYEPDRFGNPSGAAFFAGDSSSYIDIAATNLDLNFPITVSAWVSYGPGQGGPRIFSTSGYELVLGSSGQSPTSPIGINGPGPGCTSTININAGVWSYVVAEWTTNEMSIFINGVSCGSSPTTLPLNYSRWPTARIGGNSGKTSDDNYGGGIADLVVYNRALSPLEIGELYQSALVAGITVVPGILIAGNSNQTYSIQYVTSLPSTNWTTLVSNITLQGNSLLYPDTNAVGQPQRYYRIVAQ